MRRKFTSRRLLAVAVPALVLIAGAIAYGATGSGPAPNRSVDTYVSTADSGAAPVDGLRQVHSPGHVTADIQLSVGQCHVRVLDASAGLVLPDSACTPGAVDPAVTPATIQQTICAPGYTATVRPPEAYTGRYKHDSLAEYGMTYRPTIEYDHLVPLELGGANSVSNLWPEPNTTAASNFNNPKDKVEDALRHAVCAGRLSLPDAQQAIATSWTTAIS